MTSVKIIDFIVTVSGVSLGAIFSLLIAYWQFSKQKKEEKIRNMRLLNSLITRTKKEIKENIQIVIYIENALKEGRNNNSIEHWQYVTSYVDQVSRIAYMNLLESGLLSFISENDLQLIDEAYFNFQKLYHRAYQNAAAYKFSLKNGGNNQYNEVSSIAHEIRQYIKPSLKRIVLDLNIESDGELQRNLNIKN